MIFIHLKIMAKTASETKINFRKYAKIDPSMVLQIAK